MALENVENGSATQTASKENSVKEMTDEQVKEWIKQDLHAARHLLTVIVSDPLLLNQVSDAILESARSAQPAINRVPNSK